jgi:hypothetical protein
MLEMPEKSVMLQVARSLAAASYRILAIRFSLKWRFRLQVAKNKTLASSSPSTLSHSDIAFSSSPGRFFVCSMARRSRPRQSGAGSL